MSKQGHFGTCTVERFGVETLLKKGEFLNVCFAFLDCAAHYNAEEQIAFLFFQRRARFSQTSLVMQTCTSEQLGS